VLLAKLRGFLVNLPREQKRYFVLLYDFVAVLLSLFAAMTIRWGDLHWWYTPEYAGLQLFAVSVLACLPVFYYRGLYRAVMRHANRLVLLSILKSVGIASILLLGLDALFLQHIILPRSVPFIFAVLLAGFMLWGRFFIGRWLNGASIKELVSAIFSEQQQKVGLEVLLVGGGENLVEFSEVLIRSRELHPVCIADISEQFVGGEISGLPVVEFAEVDSAYEQFGFSEVLLALPEMPRRERQKIITQAEELGLPIRTMPNIADVAAGRTSITDIQDVDLADVLGREEVEASYDLMLEAVKGRRVLVTGAGGSIGSELCRQLLVLEPKALYLLDHSEYQLYTIEKELRNSIAKMKLPVKLMSVLSSVVDAKSLNSHFLNLRPQLVYHAAAYKHVPMVESNIAQGMQNNVWGTINCALAAMQHQCEKFVLISTDKAVRPTNFMGASKRMAELALQAFSQHSEVSAEFLTALYRDEAFEFALSEVSNNTLFTMVRFGNVLGSSGSVVPLFKEQILRGGPITVTHPDIIRYFMSIPEASSLVIQASAMSKGGEVFVLDMGEPIKIVDIAKQMVKLSGLMVKSDDELSGGGDIEIVYSGLRPGEKLYEELLIGDNPEKTDHARVMKANEKSLTLCDFIALLKQVDCAIYEDEQNRLASLLAIDEVAYKRVNHA